MVEAIVKQDQQYRVSFSNGIVDVFSPRARDDPSNLLNKVLKDFSVTEMETPQRRSYEGLSWQYNTVAGRSLVGHWGVDIGVSTDMWLDPATGAGYIVLTNGDVYRRNYANFESNGPYVAPVQAMIDIGAALLEIGESG